MKIIIGDTTKKYMKILNLEKFPFSKEDLKKNYRLMLHEYHEDKGGDKEKTRQIIEAYDFLKNMVSENVENINRKEKKKNIFDLSEECPECNGMGKKGVEEFDHRECPECKGHGRTISKCHCCNNGKFTLKSGREVECRRCNGTGIFVHKRNICFRCCGSGQIFGFGESKIIFRECRKCKGSGRIEIKRFNPVIPPGAILF